MQELEFKILAYLKGELNKDERHQVEQWVAQSDVNQQAFNEIEKIYLSSELDTSTINLDVDRAWNAVAAAISQTQTSGRAMLYRVAAMITLLIGLGFVVFQYQNQGELLVARTGDNEIKKIELTDGTVVWLNENSVFTYPKELAAEQRLVALKGQAYFDVAKDPQRPFRIVGAQTAVQVLGTSFDFVSRGDYANINVTSGRVSFELVDNEEVKVILEKGSQATCKSNKIVKNEGFDENASSWMTKDFIFKSSPLYAVVDKLSQHFDVKIKVDDAIKNCLITSSFEDKELDQILDTLEAIANIKSEKKGKTIKLTGPGC